MLRERKLSSTKSQIAITKDRLGSAFQYKTTKYQHALRGASLSNKLWNMVKSKAIESIPKNGLTKQRSVIKTECKRTKSLSRINSTKQILYNDMRTVCTKQENTMMKDTMQNFRISYKDKTDKLCRLTCKKLLRHLKDTGEYNSKIWKLDRNVDFWFILTNKKNEKSCDIKISWIMRYVVIAMVGALITNQYYNIVDHEKLSSLVKVKIEGFVNAYAFKPVQVRFETTDNELYRFFELYTIQHENLKDHIASNMTIKKLSKLHNIKIKNVIDTLTHKDDISIICELLNIDYEKLFISHNKLYTQVPREPQQENRPPMCQDLSEILDKPQSTNKALFLKRYKEIQRQASSSKEKRPIEKRFTITQSLIRKQTDSINGDIDHNPQPVRILKKYQTNALHRERSGSILQNSLIQQSGSKLYISTQGERKVQDFYRPDNTEHIDKALEFIKKKNFAAVSFGKFKNVIEGKEKDVYVSKFGYKADVEDINKDLMVSNGVLEDNVELFNNYFEDYNL